MSFLLFFVVAMYSCKQGKPQEQMSAGPQQEMEKERFQAGKRLEAMLCERDFERALQYLDSLHTAYPDEPQFYFGEGWMYDMQEDSLRARAAFTKALDIYDSLLAVRTDLGDQIHRAILVQILYGQEAYTQTLDGMLRTAKNFDDSLNIEVLREYVYDKNRFFQPGSNNTYPACYKYCPQDGGDKDVAEQHDFMELFFEGGKPVTGTFWGTTNEFVATATEGRQPGYFVLPLNVLEQRQDTVFCSLKISGHDRFFQKPINPRADASMAALQRAVLKKENDYYPNTELALTDSVAILRVIVKGDTLYVSNTKWKEHQNRKFIRVDNNNL